MSKVNKQRNKAALKKQNKGAHKGEDKSAKPKYSHQQPKADWMNIKKKKSNSKAALASAAKAHGVRIAADNQ
jgi:hypothetical protein